MQWRSTLAALLVALALTGCAQGTGAKPDLHTRLIRERTTGSGPSTAVEMVAVVGAAGCSWQGAPSSGASKTEWRCGDPRDRRSNDR
jgi:hypothetical protein